MEEDKENIGNFKVEENGRGGVPRLTKTLPDVPHCENFGDEGTSEPTMPPSPGAVAESTLRSSRSSKQPFQHGKHSRSKQKQPMSPMDADLFMVSPRPYDPHRKASTTPTTPANSETILSAFRQVENTLNAEIHDVKLLASAGTTSKKSHGRCLMEEEDAGDAIISSPESDVDKSPVPPSFPPMPSSTISFHSPMRTTPMDYSSLSNTPKIAASPLPSTSLLPILSTLEEDHHSDESESVEVGGGHESSSEVSLAASDDFSDQLSSKNETYVEGGVKTKQAKDDEKSPDDAPSSAESESNSTDETDLPMEEIEFHKMDVSSFDSTPTSKRSKPETDEEDDDDAPEFKTESPLQPMELYENDGDETVAREKMALPTYHREESSESEEEPSVQIFSDGTKENAAKTSDSDHEEEEVPDESVSDRMKETPIECDLSKLDLNDDDSNDESLTFHNHNDDDNTISGTSDVVLKKDSCATCKSTAESEQAVSTYVGGILGLKLDTSTDSEEDDYASKSDSKNDEPTIGNSIGSISASSDDANEAEPEDDDESLMCFDGCGCWALDEAHPGDLYLSDNSDVKWPRIRLPMALYNKLFQHQRIGVQWMASLHRNEIKGGILADDMGMGKTMQVLSYLGSLMRAQTISNAIVICPKSVVRSWEREANLILKNMCVKNASITAITADMSKEKRKSFFTDAFCSSARVPHLIITTYGIVSNHITDLSKIASVFEEFHWSYVILDEGHLIKNRKTKTSQDVRILSRSKKTRRVLLTGTPIQNNMRELHSLFDWATSSKLLGSIQTFLNKYGDPIEEGRQRNASEWAIKKATEMNVKLKKTLAPYFLQRLKKTTFENELPEKKELVVFTQLSAKQRRMYEDFTFDGETQSPLAAVSWLKMLCGHPSLIKEASRKYKSCDIDLLVKDSSKLQVLLALLNRLKRSGHRALVFSQSTKMLDIMEKVMDGSISYLRIDGSSAQNARQKSVDHFNASDCEIDIMLLSTKAAGTGLTLTGADRAIIYDPSWNPAEDAQAVDRCYRIGQTKNVTVYRFIAAGTVEEKMYEKQVHKDGIKRVVLSSDRSTARYFVHSELADLFKLAPPGECSMMEKFNEKSNNNASGSSGKPSFLSKHPLVIGVASHDVLYSTDSVDVDLTSPGSSEVTPFSRSPFQKAKAKTHSIATQIEDLTAQIDGGMVPLGGNSQTRQIREDAKAKRNEENAKKSQPAGFVSNILDKVDAFIMNQKHDKAMLVLLDLVEKEIDLIKGDEKLAVHEKISHVAHILGWL